MTKEEFMTLDQDSVKVIDIREAEELEALPCTIPATHMPMGKAFVEAIKGHLEKDKPVISLCQTGGRCKVLTEQLTKMGYQADYLEGGLNALAEE